MAAKRDVVRRIAFSGLRAATAAAFATLWAVLISLINPLHIDEWAFYRNHDIWQRIVADDYECDKRLGNAGALPCSASAPPSLTEPPVSVVYLDEASLDHRSDGQGQPSSPRPSPPRLLSLPEQTDVLRDLVPPAATHEGAPRAIFVDVLFENAAPLLRPQDVEALIHAVGPDQLQTCRAAKATTPANQPGGDHFQCYLAQVAAITHYSRWGAEAACQLDALAKLACILRSGGVPVIFATTQTLSDKDASSTTAAVQALDHVSITAPAYQEGDGYGLLPQDGAGHPLRPSADSRYPLPPSAILYAAYCWTEPAGAAATGCSVPPASVGTLLSSQAYDGDDARDGDKARSDQARLNWPQQRVADGADWEETLSRLRWSPAYVDPIDVSWGVGDTARDPILQMLERFHGPMDCRSAQPGMFGRFMRLLAELAPSFLGNGKPPCLYVPAVPYADFDAFMTQDQIKMVLNNKIVMFGGQFQTSPDWIPALGFLAPGVQYHAMALANLIRDGAQYRKVGLAVARGSALSLASWPTFLAIFGLNVCGGLAIMILNEKGLDPALVSLDRRIGPRSGLAGLLRGRNARWLVRIAVVAIFVLSPLALFAFATPCLYALSLNAMIGVLVSIAIKLLFRAIHPLIEEGRRLFRFLDVADTRLLEGDIDPVVQPPVAHKSKSKSKTRVRPKSKEGA